MDAYLTALYQQAAKKLTGRAVNFRPRAPIYKGFSGQAYNCEGAAVIDLDPKLPPADRLEVFTHECAHIKVHFSRIVKVTPEDLDKSPGAVASYYQAAGKIKEYQLSPMEGEADGIARGWLAEAEQEYQKYGSLLQALEERKLLALANRHSEAVKQQAAEIARAATAEQPTKGPLLSVSASKESQAAARENLKNALKNALRYIAGHQKEIIKAAAKPAPKRASLLGRRDPREPDREKKHQAETLIDAAMQKHFDKQAEKVREWLAAQYPERKATTKQPPVFPDWEEDPELEGELLIILQDAAKRGATLFQQKLGVSLDYTGINRRAREWAKQYTFDLVKGIDETTRKALQQALSAFVETPGFTIGDVMRQLPFEEVRAQMVAVTEITRAYATGNRQAAEQLKEENPDLEIVRVWYTNNDDRVCTAICEGLDREEAPVGEPFINPDSGESYDDPPAHVACRCWTNYHSRI